MKFFKSSKVSSMIKKAQGFHSCHTSDPNLYNKYQPKGSDWLKEKKDNSLLSDRQRNIIDYIMNNNVIAPTVNTDTSELPKETQYYDVSPLIDIIMKSNRYSDIIAESDKKLLFKTWNASRIVQDGKAPTEKVLEVSADTTQKDLNQLKSKGLVVGTGMNISLTEKGSKLLVKLMLDSESDLCKMSSSLQKIIKTCGLLEKTIIQVPGGKIERREDGSWEFVANGDEDIEF